MAVKDEKQPDATALEEPNPTTELSPEASTSSDAPDVTSPEETQPEIVVAPEPSVPELVIPETHDHVAIRDFAARFAHQVLHFKAGEVIERRIGIALRAQGSPIKLVERVGEETQGER